MNYPDDQNIRIETEKSYFTKNLAGYFAAIVIVLLMRDAEIIEKSVSEVITLGLLGATGIYALVFFFRKKRSNNESMGLSKLNIKHKK